MPLKSRSLLCELKSELSNLKCRIWNIRVLWGKSTGTQSLQVVTNWLCRLGYGFMSQYDLLIFPTVPVRTAWPVAEVCHSNRRIQMVKQSLLIILKCEIVIKNLKMALHFIFRKLLVNKLTPIRFSVVKIMCHSLFSQP